MGSKKGPTAELEVRRLLVEWWRKLEPGIEITRTPGSGGWRHAVKWGAKADLMIKDAPRFPFGIEVKRREGWSPRELFAGRPSPVWAWWVKTCQDAQENGGTVPMLWFRRNREPWLVMFPSTWWGQLGDRDSLPSPAAEWDQGLPIGSAPHPVVVFAHDLLSEDPVRFALPSGS